jgi:hypothetical protein
MSTGPEQEKNNNGPANYNEINMFLLPCVVLKTEWTWGWNDK